MWLAILLLGTLPRDACVRERCDRIEHNHFYDDHGRPVFEQIIFYDWSDEHGRYMVRDWRLLKNRSQVPKYDWPRRCWRVCWLEGDVLRNVSAESRVVTWTQVDPELVDRDFLHKDKRRKLAEP